LVGSSVAISRDTVVVAAEGEASGAGCVYVFTDVADRYTQSAELGPGGRLANTNFGESVAVSNGVIVVGLGNVAALGFARDDYIFTQEQSGWRNVAELDGAI
jgi:hypothetical protein